MHCMADSPTSSASSDEGLRVTKGASSVPSINPNARPRRKSSLSVDEYVAGIRRGDRVVLSRAITLVESNRPADQSAARDLVERCLPYSGHAMRVGITGVPGVGKSTFIEAIGGVLLERGHRLAVLAIDPSSAQSKGSILGDKTRMERLAAHPQAFVRPSPTSGSLGGVARSTRETMTLCEAAGFDVIFVETVGVGQSEIAVHALVDFFLLLVLAGAGDELQGIKRGIVEMADAIVVTKADGSNEAAAREARGQYRNALHLFPARSDAWRPPVQVCSALTGAGVEAVWQTVEQFFAAARAQGSLDQRRADQAQYWMMEAIRNALEADFFGHPAVTTELARLEREVRDGSISSYAAADYLTRRYRAAQRASNTDD